MKRYWLGAAAAFLSVSGAFVLLSFIVPPTYESTSVIEITAPTPLDSKALAAEIRTSIQESGRLQELAGHPLPGEDPAAALERARRSFQVAARSERAFSISFEGRRPEWAQHGSQLLLDAVLEHFARDAPQRDEKQARADLEKRTRELADFVTLHPDFSPGPTSAPPESSPQPSRSASVPRDDPTLSLLRQERARLESKLVDAQSASDHESFKNPYDDEADSDVATIGRQLAQVRLAIAAHQKAITERAATPPTPSPEVAAEAARKASLASEWRRLVKAVVDAQGAPPPKREAGPVRTVQVLERPLLPSRPVKPNRPLVAVVGLLLGSCAGAVWAFTRVNVHDRARRRALAAREQPPATGSFAAPPTALPSGAPEPAAETSDPRETIGLAATVAVLAATETEPSPTQGNAEPSPLAAAEPHRRALSPSQGTQGASHPRDEPKRTSSPPQGQGARPGLQARSTRRGMVDPELVKAQTGATPQSFVQRVEGKRIVDVSGDRRSDPPPPNREKRSQAPHRPKEAFAGQPRSVTPAGPTSAPPITQRIGSPGDPAEAPAHQRPSTHPEPDRPDTSYSFVDRGWRATSKRTSSRPPGRPPQWSESSGEPAGASPRSHELREPPIGATRPSAAPNVAVRSGTAPPLEEPPAHRTPPATPRVDVETHGPSNPPGATRPGWARPSPPPSAGVAEVWTKVAGPPDPAADDIVEPRSVPPTWNRLAAASTANGAHDELSALSEKLTELSSDRCFVVGVISDRTELEAKSQVAASLATMVAEGTPRVLLMEGNFDWPAVHRQMAVSMPNFSGFSQQMHARTRKTERKPWIVVRCSSNLDVLAEGIVRSPGVLYSQQFAEAVAELRRYYKVIVCDGPIVGGADAKPLDAVTDGLIVVAPSQRALMNSLDKAARWFSHKQLLAAVPAAAGK